MDKSKREALESALASAIEAIHESFKAAPPESHDNVEQVISAATVLAKASVALEVD